MDQPPTKRRRTSPNTAVTVNPSNTRLRAHSQDGNAPGPSSYTSPTKASLARFYPHLLAKAESSHTPRSKGRLLLEQRSSTIKGAQNSDPKIQPLPQLVSAAKASLLRDVALKAQTVNTKSTPSQSNTESGERNPFKSTDQTFSFSFSQSVKDNESQEPRASPPMEAVNMNAAEFGTSIAVESRHSRTISPLEESGMQPGADTNLSHSPPLETNAPLEIGTDNVHGPSSLSDDEVVVLPTTPTRGRIVMVEGCEPRLPSTPRQLGIEPPGSKPTGLLSISPNRKVERSRPVGMKSSPLKPNATPVQQVVETQSESSLGPCRSVLELSREQSTLETEESPTSDHPDPDRTLGSGNHYPENIASSPTSGLPALNRPHQVQAASSFIVSMSDVRNSDDAVFHNLHSRDVTCKSSDGILFVEVRMFLKEVSGKVAFVDVIKIPPWASELQAWLKAPIADRNQDAIKHAISRFWDMSETRAFSWHSCEGIFGDLVDRTEDMKAATEETAGIKEVVGDARPQDGSTDPTHGTAFAPAHSQFHLQDCPPQTMLRYLGQKSCRLRDADVSLHVLWNINFTPSGQVTSKVSASASFPPTWIENQDQSDLSRVDELFARLVRSGKPVVEAMRCIVEVVFPK